jgi:hypothetical protein
MPPWTTAESSVESPCVNFQPQLRIPRPQRVSQSRSIPELHKNLGLTVLPVARRFFFTLHRKTSFSDLTCIFPTTDTRRTSASWRCPAREGER